MSPRRNFVIALLSLLPACLIPACLLPARASAAVADSGPSGFTVKITTNIHGSPDVTYRTLTRNIGDWWDSSHTFSRNSHNLSIEEKALGCFCEKLPDGGGVRHMQVLYIAPGKSLIMTGALGPLQPLAVTGTLTIQLSPDGGGTKLEVTYAVAGYLPAGMNTWASPVDGMLSQQFSRLKNYVEHGDPAQSK